jgi:hypothetical protein
VNELPRRCLLLATFHRFLPHDGKSDRREGEYDMKARSILLAAAGALAVTGLAAPAFAQPHDWHHDHHDHWHGHDRYYPPPPRPHYVPPPPVVYAPPPAYYAPPPPVVYASPGITFGITIP